MKSIPILIILFLLPNLGYSLTEWTTGTYRNNEDISKTLTIIDASTLTVKIKGATQEYFDFVYIYNGRTGDLIQIFHGQIDETFIVNESSVRVRFTSNHVLTGVGITVSVSKARISSGAPNVEDIPQIMRAKGWGFSAKLMDRWFNGTGGIYYTDLSILKDKFQEIETAFNTYADQIENNSLTLQDSMMTPLIRSLKKLDNGTGGIVIPDGGSFNFIEHELSKAGSTWSPESYTSETNDMNWFGDEILGDDVSDYLFLDEFIAAFAKVAIRIVPNGHVNVNSDGTLTIYITEIGIYLRDSYDFHTAPGKDEQSLGCWSFSHPYVTSKFDKIRFGNEPYFCVDNETFRSHNLRNGDDQHQGNYRIFSTILNEHRKNTNLTYTHVPERSYPNTTQYYIDKCVSTLGEYFGNKSDSSFTCHDSENSEYLCQRTDGKVSLIAIKKNLEGNKFLYYWGGSGFGSLDQC